MSRCRASGAPRVDAFSWLMPWVVCILSMCPQQSFAVEPGELAPDFLLPILTDPASSSQPAPTDPRRSFSLVNLSDYRGRVVYLDFWDTSCGPCRDALPALEEIRRQFARADFEILAVNLDSNPRTALQFLAQYPVSYPVASDPGAYVAELYGLRALPGAFFIARDGTVRSVHRGYNVADLPAIQLELKTMINENNEG